ncbi:TenA family protein [Fructobacillus sp. M1-13]|uniref:Aminopyrimidine aminohydrolase n=1 Tax=Fructobacillus papyriferae TaxID=2713171 RepID=A0ABS5QQQ0_9LACO|nr:TenA family protein [Fructobacillus papyriferae]MBS9334664.1 hypothetical protein [Fructobacillus papyriferae]MCD2158654.1 TenA family protein [Fructobacillus papyriferae]
MTFIEQFKKMMHEAMPAFLANPFIQNCEAGRVDARALYTYIEQDNVYLAVYLPLFSKGLDNFGIDSKALRQFEGDQETKPHLMLQKLADEKNPAAKKSITKKWLPATSAYLKHIQDSQKENDFIFLCSLAACPYVYGYLTEKMIADGRMTKDNPFYPWFDFYKGTDGQLIVDFMKVLKEEADKVDEAIQSRGLTAFYQAVQFENDFFAQSMEKEA